MPKNMPNPTTELGARLQKLRTEADLREVELAREIGYIDSGAGRVREWESGRHIPTLSLLQRIAEVYDITVSELLDGVM